MKMSNSKKIHDFHTREFLCSHTSGIDSFFAGSVKLSEYLEDWDFDNECPMKEKRKTLSLQGEAKFAGCESSVHWNFSLYREKDLLPVKEKAARARMLLTRFFDELDVALEKYEREKEKGKEK